MEWLEKSEHYEFTDMEYSFLVNLHAKVHGLYRAEKFIEEIPQSMRTTHVYQSLLAGCASMRNVPTTEKVFNKMKDLNFPLTAFACNQLLLLYKRNDKKKITDVLLMMEKENIKPTLFTYKMLIDTKGIVGDFSGMEQLLDTMKEDGIKLDMHLSFLVARHYIKGGHTKKAEKLAKEMEGGDFSDKIQVRKFLLNIYAELGMPDEVERIWKTCGVNPLIKEWIQVIWAWAKLGKEEHVQKLVDEMFKQYKKIPHVCYNSLLRVYVDKKMLGKAKDLVKQMSDEGIHIGPKTIDTFVRLYLVEGDVATADSVLKSWVHKNHKLHKPLYYTYVHLLEAYAKKGDYHNAEKVFYLARQMGYSARMKMYELLLGAYVNAKVPAYGFRDRLRADNIFPRRVLTEQLVAVDPFKKAPVTGLLE
ncbi:Pentatricopeptide repeat-containing protein [Rhynchospora pubera]|uniref:Pentatricopeptide repeat-containing protein n=1 Tax=Rhynchospora pubera TaxID=906938 RepID=A0AAV8GHD6_9POAL|nr:Pentatricopeptide repeat-containing protein [Rhynchospora pubera]